MYYSFSPRDNANRATLTINGRKVGRVHFRDFDAWLNPYKKSGIKGKLELEALGLRVEKDESNKSFPTKVYLNSNVESDIAKSLENAFYDL